MVIDEFKLALTVNRLSIVISVVGRSSLLFYFLKYGVLIYIIMMKKLNSNSDRLV